MANFIFIYLFVSYWSEGEVIWIRASHWSDLAWKSHNKIPCISGKNGFCRTIDSLKSACRGRESGWGLWEGEKGMGEWHSTCSAKSCTWRIISSNLLTTGLSGSEPFVSICLAVREHEQAFGVQTILCFYYLTISLLSIKWNISKCICRKVVDCPAA